MAVTRDYSIQNIENKDTFASAPTDYSGYSSGAVQGGNMLLGGAISRTSTSGGRVATVKAGEDIRPALESLRSAGGGTLLLLAGIHRPTYDVIGASKINIVGEGRDQTIIDFNFQNYRVKYLGTTTEYIENFNISNLTVKNSLCQVYGLSASFSGALDILLARYFTISNVRITGAEHSGLKIESSLYFTVADSFFDGNGRHGLFINNGEGAYTPATVGYYSVQNCIADSNVFTGFLSNGSLSSGLSGNYLACHSFDNGQNGFYLYGGESMSIIGCSAESNGLHGFSNLAGSSQLVGLSARNNASNGIYTDAGTTTVVGCFSTGNTLKNYKILRRADRGIQATFVGNILNRLTNPSPVDSFDFLDADTTFTGSAAGSLGENYNAYNFVNTSGVTLDAGMVVILKPTANGYECTTTTTVGDDKVFGMLVHSVPNNGAGNVLTTGKTALLKVNGTTDIAIGDFLCTYSEAGIAAKATAGDMAFAIALEAYTANDSNGVIDALLITPRKL